jgi:phosphoglycerol transferase MdoB-like AlkP superfamily enzyme
MSNNLSNQQLKPDPKGKAIASFVLGIVSMIPTVLFLIALLLATITESLLGLLVLLFPLSMIIGLIGLILGIKGLESSKRNLAKTGIVICLLALLVQPLFFMFVGFLPCPPYVCRLFEPLYLMF